MAEREALVALPRRVHRIGKTKASAQIVGQCGEPEIRLVEAASMGRVSDSKAALEAFDSSVLYWIRSSRPTWSKSQANFWFKTPDRCQKKWSPAFRQKAV
jgi:hypothetical protein